MLLSSPVNKDAAMLFHSGSSAGRLVVSEGGKRAMVTREVDTKDGWLKGVWVITADDPPGPVDVKITIEGSVVQKFNWTLGSPSSDQSHE